MEKKPGFGMLVLAMLAGFALFCGGWYLSRAALPEPWRVNASRRPAAEESIPLEEPGQEASSYPESLLPDERIDINSADAYDLQRLPGIGEKRALDIIAWREEHGPFQSVDGLEQVSGIGPGILEGLREYAWAGQPDGAPAGGS